MFDNGYVVIAELTPLDGVNRYEKVSGIFETFQEAQDEAYEYDMNHPELSLFGYNIAVVEQSL